MPLSSRTFSQLIDFTRTSAATFVNSSGNIASTPQSRNLLTFTNEFANAAWTKSNSQIVPNVNPAAATLGAELVTNGDFASGTGWTANAGWAIGSGVATATSTSTSLFGGGFTPTAGRLYRVDFDVVSYTSGTLAITVGANYTGESSLTGGAMAAGRKTVYVVSGTNTSRGVEFYGGAISAVIDNVSVREVIGGALQAPDGTMTADTLTDDATSGQHRIQQFTGASATTYAFSVYAKAGTHSFVQLLCTSGSGTNGWFTAIANLATGAVTQTGNGSSGTLTSSSITSVGNGWYRISVVGLVSTASPVFRIAMVPAASGNSLNATDGTVTYAGTGTSIFIWGAQLEQASAATDYTRNFGGLFPPRFDYDPVTRAPRGLLIEEQRTNLLTYSEQLDNAAWTKGGATVTANSTTSPDGTVDADTLAEDTSTGDHRTFQTVTVSNTTAYAFSVFVKPNGRSLVTLTFSGVGEATYNVSTGVVTNTALGTAEIQNAGNGWYRCILRFTTATTSYNAQIRLVSTGTTTSYTGDGTSGIYLWGAQLEAGAFATSYIPTVASQVTRTGDSALIQAPMFASWYNQASGSFVVEATGYVVDTNTRSILSAYASGATSNNILFINAVQRQFQINNSGNQADIDGGTPASGVVTKAAGAYAANDFALSLGGAAVVTDTSGTIPTVDTLAIGASSLGTTQLNGWVRSIRYYPTRLSNAQLQALTA